MPEPTALLSSNATGNFTGGTISEMDKLKAIFVRRCFYIQSNERPVPIYSQPLKLKPIIE
jgi:hypothetical protein